MSAEPTRRAQQSHLAARGAAVAGWGWAASPLIVAWGLDNGGTFYANLVLAIPLAFLALFYLWRSGIAPRAILALLLLCWPIASVTALAGGMVNFGWTRWGLTVMTLATPLLFAQLFANWASVFNKPKLLATSRFILRCLLWGVLPLAALAMFTWGMPGPSIVDPVGANYLAGVNISGLPWWRQWLVLGLSGTFMFVSFLYKVCPLYGLIKFQAIWRWRSYPTRVPLAPSAR
jgi:hypothetical protein